MTQPDQIVAGYLATWNACDEEERRLLLHQHWSPRVRYVDPLADVAGHDGIAAVHAQFPSSVFGQVGLVAARPPRSPARRFLDMVPA